MLEGVQQFLRSRSCTHQAAQIGSIIDSVAILHSSSVVQTMHPCMTTYPNNKQASMQQHASLAN